MKENLTKEDLEFLQFLRSRATCGTNEEEKDRTRIEFTLETSTSAKKPNFIKKISPFL